MLPVTEVVYLASDGTPLIMYGTSFLTPEDAAEIHKAKGREVRVEGNRVTVRLGRPRFTLPEELEREG